MEIRSDITKICLITRKPEAVKKKNIGAWKYIIEFIGVMSIISNILFCYLYNKNYGEIKYNTITFTVLEHFLILFILILRLIFPTTVEWVKIYKLRSFFRRKEAIMKLRENK